MALQLSVACASILGCYVALILAATHCNTLRHTAGNNVAATMVLQLVVACVSIVGCYVKRRHSKEAFSYGKAITFVAARNRSLLHTLIPPNVCVCCIVLQCIAFWYGKAITLVAARNFSPLHILIQPFTTCKRVAVC